MRERRRATRTQVRDGGPAHRPATGGVSIFEDLGIQQAPHSTLNSLPREAVCAAHRQLRRAGRDEPPHRTSPAWSAARRPGRDGVEPSTPVGGHRIITGLVPVQRDPRRDPHRSSRPLPGACSSSRATRCTRSPTASACARRSRALDLVVVIDVAMTETARCADYVLPGGDRSSRSGSARSSTSSSRTTTSSSADRCSSRWRARCRSRRSTPAWCRALGAYNDDDLAPLHAAAAIGRAEFAAALFGLAAERPATWASCCRSSSTRRSDRRCAAGRRRRRRCGRGVGAGPDGCRILGRVGAPRRLRASRPRRIARRRPVRRPAGQPVRASRSRSTTTTRRCAGSPRPTVAINLVHPGAARGVRRSGHRAGVGRHAIGSATRSRSCCRPASAGRRPRTRSSATRRGARTTSTVRCACRPADAERFGLGVGRAGAGRRPSGAARSRSSRSPT